LERAVLRAKVAGNYIGTDPTGQTAIPNSSRGIIATGQFNTIGVDGDGSAGEANEGNLISGNLGPGIDLHSSAAENVVAGNLVGLTATGDAALPNGIDGVRIYHS